MARFLICVLDAKAGYVIATQEIEVRALIEVPERFFEFAADFPQPCYGSGFPLDDDAGKMLNDALERLPPHVRELFKQAMS